MGKHLGLMFLPSIYTERAEGNSLRVTADKFNLGSWVVSTTYVLNKTPRVVTFFIIVDCGSDLFNYLARKELR